MSKTLRCFAFVNPNIRPPLPCHENATDEIAGQHFCQEHAEEIRRAVLNDVTVYYLRGADGLIKIGISRFPERRAEQLKGEILALEAGGRDRERYLHLLFALDRVHGEWFTPTAGLLEHIRQVARAA